MKMLFIIQGEGRGHLTQALSLRQKLADEGHQVVGVLVLPAVFLTSLQRKSMHRFILSKVRISSLRQRTNRLIC